MGARAASLRAGFLRRAGLTPSPALLIERLSPRLPGESDPGVFEGSGPGNDGGAGPPCVSYLINPAMSFFALFGTKNISDLPEAKLKPENKTTVHHLLYTLFTFLHHGLL